MLHFLLKNQPLPVPLVLWQEKGGNPELVKESQRRRYAKVELVDEVMRLDQEWRARKWVTDLAWRESTMIMATIVRCCWLSNAPLSLFPNGTQADSN